MNFDERDYQKKLESLLNGVMAIFRESKGLAFSTRKAGGIVLDLLVHDEVVERFGQHCGQNGEVAYANYWAAKALALGMIGKQAEGRVYLDKAHKRRAGGPFAEWCQSYYK